MFRKASIETKNKKLYQNVSLVDQHFSSCGIIASNNLENFISRYGKQVFIYTIEFYGAASLALQIGAK